MTELEQALQAGAVEMTDYDRALQAGAQEVTAPKPSRRGYAEPKSFRASDVDLGIESGPIRGDVREFAGAKYATPDAVQMAGGQNESSMFGPHPRRPQTELEGDPLAQMVVASTVLGPVGRAATAAVKPLLGAGAAPTVAAGEGAAASKSMGGSPVAGAMLGGAFGALGAAAKGATPSAAAARTNARLVGDINKGATKATARNARNVEFKAGEGGENLARVANEVPEAGKALKTKAKTNPRAAADETGAVVDELTAQNDEVFDAIQAQHGGAPVKALTDRAANLWFELTQKGKGQSADAVKRFHDDLIGRYGADVNLSAEQLRNIRNDIGEAAFPTPGAKPSTKRFAENKLYKVFNEVIEDVASRTEGVDVAALKARNNQISTLLPAQKALAERAGKLGDRDLSLYQRAKEIPPRAGQRVAREVDYRLSQLPGAANAVDDVAIPASVPTSVDIQRRRPPASLVAQYLLTGGAQ